MKTKRCDRKCTENKTSSTDEATRQTSDKKYSVEVMLEPGDDGDNMTVARLCSSHVNSN